MHRWQRYLLKTQWLWAFFALPIINITAFFWADALQENISHIANATQHFGYVILWVLSCAIYLELYTAIFCIKVRFTKKTGWFCFSFSCLLMVLSILLPYQPDNYPLLAKLHVDIAMLGTVCYVVSLLWIFHHLYFYEPALFTALFPWYILIVGSCAFLFLLMGNVSTLIETMFVIGMGYFWFYASKKVNETR